MHLTTIYRKRTRKGNVVTINRELYLRDDLTCGIEHCDECNHPSSIIHHPSSITPLSSHPQNNLYLILDTNILLHQFDIISLAPPSLFHNLIILQTVLKEVKNKSLFLYNKIRSFIKESQENNHSSSIIQQPSSTPSSLIHTSSSIIHHPSSTRNVYVFSNEHHRETFTERHPAESTNDYHDRLIRTATLWYSKHVSGTVSGTLAGTLGVPDKVPDNLPHILLLTNDRQNKTLAIQQGLLAKTLREYLTENLTEGSSTLLELVAVDDVDDDVNDDVDDINNLQSNKSSTSIIHHPSRRQHLFPDHLPPATAQRRIKQGLLVQGTLRVNRDNVTEGIVKIKNHSSSTIDVLIRGSRHMNRAMDGDEVVIKVLPPQQWKSPSRRGVVDADVGGDVSDDDNDDVGDDNDGGDSGNKVLTILTTPAPSPTQKPTAKIVCITKRGWRNYCGTIDESSLPNQPDAFLVIPVDRKIPKIKIITKQINVLSNQRIVVNVDGWSVTSPYPTGHYVRALGTVGEREVENDVLLIEHDVPVRPFSHRVMECLPQMPWIITPDDVLQRRDLRHVRVMSIDPPGCEDIDDALSIRLLENGNWEIGVHIADVTHFVKPDTPLDDEAAYRATSVYLVERRIDMLPRLLNAVLCSLVPDVDRLAFSVLWEVCPVTGSIIQTSFTKSIIHSHHAWSYGEAQLIIDDVTRNDEIAVDLRRLLHIAKILKNKRYKAGALTLASAEVKFTIDHETHSATDVTTYVTKESNALVEEFMLLANQSVAIQILSVFPHQSLLRCHPAPTPSNFDYLIYITRLHGFSIDISSSFALAQSLDACVKPNDMYFNKIIRILTTRCMQQAVYICSGMTTDYHHYGLAMDYYTHFTSPIRRYSDVITHRLLSASLNLTPLPPALINKMKLHDACDVLNRRHYLAQQANRASVELHTLLYFKNYPVDEDAIIIKTRNNGVMILVPRYGIEGMCLMGDVINDRLLKKQRMLVLLVTQAHKERASVKTNETRVILPLSDVPSPVIATYNDERQNLQLASNITLDVFDWIRVRIFVDDSYIYRHSLVFYYLYKIDKNDDTVISTASSNRLSSTQICPILPSSLSQSIYQGDVDDVAGAGAEGGKGAGGAAAEPQNPTSNTPNLIENCRRKK